MSTVSRSPCHRLMARPRALAVLSLGTSLATSFCQAQMVAPPEHVLRSFSLNAPEQRAPIEPAEFGRHWEGRIGVTLGGTNAPLNSRDGMAGPRLGGALSLRSAHVLSDYYFANGFRATAGLLRGSVTQSWWTDADANSPLTLSLHRLDTLSLATAGNHTTSEGQTRTQTYVGGGYSARLTPVGTATPWRFNADLGIISVNNGNIGKISRVFSGEDSVGSLSKELRLRPLFKISVRHAF